METKIITADLLIIGGGAAGCYAAKQAALRNPQLKIVIAEKADVRRSGCLAAGVNALNAYITKGKTPDFYVDYAKNDANGIVREDLLLTLSQRLNQVTADLEKMGLVILKDENGDYVPRGNRNIKINGENIKEILAKGARRQRHVKIVNHVNITDFLVQDQQIYGAVGFSPKDQVAYTFYAKAVLVATGGASGLYRPNNPGFSKHKMWYPPFNTGAGYAMGIRAGAEMTTFEMRFIALRCKDTIAPTGTIAQGVGAKQINQLGEVYETKYGLKTSERVYGTVQENKAGRGPCYLKTTDITDQQEQDLYHAYLNMNPAQTLRWLENGGPKTHNVEIEGTEPYIVGGHCASGYWVSTDRQTTIHGLFAAGDVAGGAPQKYVTGALAEGDIAAEAIVAQLQTNYPPQPATIAQQADALIQRGLAYFENDPNNSSIATVEQSMQAVMDQYAGGISQYYGYTEAGLKIAANKIKQLQQTIEQAPVTNMHALMSLYEVKERLVVCLCVIAHLAARKETRWHSFAENLDFPETDAQFNKYVNSIYKDGDIQIIYRDFVKRDDVYEHSN
ncbi:adenylylsulfate reductase [Agrilactobacillus composti DSM 18527 = JCM 14202]|uniref:Adenylylsulfate reductase n=1 Tax=Agrilactobacillus composti DSM 18527 = JCM 14202 TaxID=1423734 RepID=X0PN84_9LACO|nr:adenylyl-sulfate reductase subunit alpha [Agrilactobacillus composti]KRM30547.1 adenylylsulfate reductase [Agrilactobacillus composti DSM 18527 = JCM 14202]GAF38386.1 adenylylsulfate reductase alpha-subunit [Agrilactobacillus composti DSM 18527 = JCM 14202]